METKNYEERVNQVKRDVIDDIKAELNGRKKFELTDPQYIHYVDGELADTEVCESLSLDDDGKLFLHSHLDGSFPHVEKYSVDEGGLLSYDSDSLIAILEEVKKELREEKLQTLRELVKNAGGSLTFDGNFAFDSFNAEDATDNRCYSDTELLGLRIENDNLIVKNFWEGENSEGDNAIPTYELDRIIEYVRKQTEVSPEERLALTDEQKIIVNRIKNDIAELNKLGGTIMLDQDYGTLFVINAKGEEFNCYGPDSEHQTKVDIAKLPSDDVIGSGYVCYTSEHIYLT